MILNSAPVNHGPVNSTAKFILALQIKASMYIKANASNYMYTNIKGLKSNIGINSQGTNKFIANFSSKPSNLSVKTESTGYLIGLWMKGTPSKLSCYTEEKDYQVVTLADYVSDDKSYIVDSLELNYFPEKVILDFYPEKLTLDM